MWAITGACCANTALQRRECLELARGALCWHDVVLYSHHNGTILDLGNKQPQIRSNIQEVHQENLGEEKKTTKRTRYVNPARIERTTLRTSQTGISRATTVPRVLTTKCHRGRTALPCPYHEDPEIPSPRRKHSARWLQTSLAGSDSGRFQPAIGTVDQSCPTHLPKLHDTSESPSHG